MLQVRERLMAQDSNLDNYSPEEKELAARFNKDFTRLMKVVPKADRRILFDLLHTASELCSIECLNWYGAGFEYGRQGKVMAGRHPLYSSSPALSSNRIQ